MATSSSDVLREYLIALGWKIDAAGAKKFDATIKGTEKAANALSKSIASVGIATSAMVAKFAYDMEKLYYASKRTKASVGNIQALQFGAEQIGISGEQMLGSLEGIAKSIRNNPGILALIKSFGIAVEGRDMSDVMRDTVKVLSSMPHYVGAQFAAMFGMDEQTFLQMKENMAELDAAVEKRKQMGADMGVDADAAALASKEFNNSWRELVANIGLFRDVLAISLLPLAKELGSVTKEVLKDWSSIIQQSNKEGGFFSKLWDGLKASMGMRLDGVAGNLTNDARHRIKLGETSGVTLGPGAPPTGAPSVPAGSQMSAADKLAALERKYGLPAGILDRVWKAESNRGDPRFMLSGAGAKGHFGFMDATAAQYGVKDPNDFDQSSEGSAKYYADLMKKYGGDARAAAAAYNWGPGKVDRYGLGRAPAETRGYMDKVAGPSINQETNITVQGAESAAETARLVAQNQRAVNADLVRNLGGSSS